jgi:hypothetical protein
VDVDAWKGQFAAAPASPNRGEAAFFGTNPISTPAWFRTPNTPGSPLHADATLVAMLEMLRVEPHHRTEEELEIIRSYFIARDIEFFNLLHPMQQLQCSRHLATRAVITGDPVYQQGELGDTFYHIVHGVVAVMQDGLELMRFFPGQSFGDAALQSEHYNEHPDSVIALEDCALATLTRTDYLRVTNDLEAEALRVLRKPPAKRTLKQLQVVMSVVKDVGFFDFEL